MSEETRIRALDEETVARIAAGEVVERPASAVKELVENSLDADASRIEVAVDAGGTEGIRVADDGHGMTEADLRAAVRQHTTSKIAGIDDLETGVATLGFRGEALHTIGSVSRMTVRSRPRAAQLDDAPAHGTELVYEGGDVVSVEPAGCPEGTIVEVTDLFFNTPARRKFLKTTATEFAHVNRVVTRYALANPDVAISLSHDGREVFATTGQGDLEAAVLAVYGRDVARAMIPIIDVDLPPGPVETVSGLVSHPETTRSTREYLATFVNDRAVTARAIHDGILDAYGGQLGTDRYPFVVCFLAVAPEVVDVNVHPRKREVRFDDEDAVRRQVEAVVEGSLLEHGLLRSGAPRGRSAPAETPVEPGAPADTAGNGASGAGDVQSRDEKRGGQSERRVGEDGSEGTDAGETTRVEEDRIGEERERARAHQRAPSETAGRPESGRDAVDSEPNEAGDGSHEREAESCEAGGGHPETASQTPSPRPASSRIANASSTPTDGPRSDADGVVDLGTEQRTLEGAPVATEMGFDRLPPMRVLGQLHDTYIVCETADGLALIDQHAADERITFERLREAVADDPSAQALATPVEVSVTASEGEAFEAYRDALARLGFYADRTGDRTVAVTTVPAFLAETAQPDQLRDVLASLVSGDVESGDETVDALAEAVLADLACYPAITANTSLTEGSVHALLSALDECANPWACPHGRPVVVHLDERELEDRFERDYPGGH